MTAARTALEALASALPPGSVVPVPVEWLTEMLRGSGGAPTEGPTTEHDLTCAEAGSLLGRSASTIRGWCESGLLEAYRQRHKEWRITPLALERFRQQERERGKHDPGASRSGVRRRQARPVDLAGWRKIPG